MTNHAEHPTSSNPNQIDGTRTKVHEELRNGTRIIYEVEIAEPGTVLDKQLSREQMQALLDLLCSAVTEQRSVGGS